jgi:uncharacterized coiled-coil protein SlyX
VLSVNPLHVVALVVLIGALWAIDHTQGENAWQADRIASLESTATHDAAVIEQQAEALANQQALATQVGQIGAATARLQRRLDQQADAMTAGLEELKRTDPDARDYLLSPVPAAVGMRHARPETTDVGAYRDAAGRVPRAGVMPAAGPTGPAGE